MKLVEKLGDTRAAAVSDRHDRLARELLGRHGGREIDKTDGFLFLFERPIDAAFYALDYHRALDSLSQELKVPLAARAGIHLGEVILRENPPEQVARGAKPLEVEGIAKPMAARVMSLAMGRQTLMTRAAFDLARRAFVGRDSGGADIRWMAHGPYTFKGVEEPVEIGEAGEEGFAPLAAPKDSEKAKRTLKAGDEDTLGWRPAKGAEIPQRSGWNLDRKLGEGAFGEVWVARQARSGVQRVFKFCFEAEKLRMLRHEVTLFQVLKEALGERDDIGRILDWQLEEAPYFLESEYAEGGTLNAWAEQSGGLENVPLPTRLEVVAQVADVLGSAHSIGILHKDVRPANILVRVEKDGRPKARLIDFGIGQIMDRKFLKDRGVGVNVTDSIMVDGRELVKRALNKELPPMSSGSGSQIYVAPELQEGLKPTIQADIYSLGVVLFQMVVGSFRRVLAPGWERDVTDDILRGDIAACVDGSPERRLGSARILAERLRTLPKRRQEAEALASATQEAERAKIMEAEQSRRRRQLAVVTVVSLVFIATVSTLALQARSRAREAESARQQAEELVGFVLTDVSDALRPVGRMKLLQQVAQKLQEYYENQPAAAAGPALHNRVLALMNIGDVKADLGQPDKALGHYRDALEAAKRLDPKDPRGALAVAGAHRAIGQVQLGQGQADAALASIEEASAALEKLGAGEAGGAPRVEVGILKGKALLAKGTSEEALQSFRSALSAGEELSRKTPDSPQVRALLAQAHGNIGRCLVDKGILDGALVSTRSARGILQGLTEADPGNAILEHELALSQAQVGHVLELQGDLDGQLEAYGGAVASLDGLVRRDPRNPSMKEGLASARESMGRTLMVRGDAAGALREHRVALTLREELAKADAGNAAGQRGLLASHLAIGEALHAQGTEDGALEALRSAWAAAEKLPADDAGQGDIARARVLTARAKVRARLGEAVEARKDVEQALGLLAPLAKAAAPTAAMQDALADALLLAGRVHAAAGGDVPAEERYKAALELAEKRLSSGESALWLDTKARALLLMGRGEEARPIVKKLTDRKWNEPELLEIARQQGLLPKA